MNLGELVSFKDNQRSTVDSWTPHAVATFSLQQEALGRLHKIEFKLSRYLGLDLIPVVVEDIKEDSRYYIESLKCLIHECRNYYKKYYITKKECKELGGFNIYQIVIDGCTFNVHRESTNTNTTVLSNIINYLLDEINKEEE